MTSGETGRRDEIPDTLFQYAWVSRGGERLDVKKVRILPFKMMRLSVVCLSVRALTKVLGTLAESLESSDTSFKTPAAVR